MHKCTHFTLQRQKFIALNLSVVFSDSEITLCNIMRKLITIYIKLTRTAQLSSYWMVTPLLHSPDLSKRDNRLAPLALHLHAAEYYGAPFSHRLFVELWMAIIKILWLLLGMINNISLFVMSLPDSSLIKRGQECENVPVCTSFCACVCVCVCVFISPEWISMFVHMLT